MASRAARRMARQVRTRVFLLAFALILTGSLLLLTGQTSAPVAASAEAFFPIGVFEDGNITNNGPALGAMIRDLKPRGLDTVLFTNNSVERQVGLLDVADRHGFNVVFAPTVELGSRWWSDAVPADLATAYRVIGPIVEQLRGHPSLKGYNIIDEPDARLTEKIALAVRVFRELDPSRPAMPTLIGLDRADVIAGAARPSVMLIDVYPVGWSNAPCDFTMRGFGYDGLDFVEYVRAVSHAKPADVPLWFILQTHRFGDGGRLSLREPNPEEVRLQHWLAIGEGAQGVFWFTYSSQQGWRGLPDNPPLYTEVTRLAHRLGPLRGTLLSLHKAADRFTVAGRGSPYVSTLTNADGSRLYALVVNRDCAGVQPLIVEVPGQRGTIRELESGRLYPLGAPISFEPGDGKVFEFVPDIGTGTRPELPQSVASEAACPPGEYRVEFYLNRELAGAPDLTRCDPVINYDWGRGGPGLDGFGPNHFSARWRGRHSFEDGVYTFTVTADDGVRIWLDGDLLIDGWRDQPATTEVATRILTSGEHEVWVEYYQHAYDAVVRVGWRHFMEPLGESSCCSASSVSGADSGHDRARD